MNGPPDLVPPWRLELDGVGTIVDLGTLASATTGSGNDSDALAILGTTFEEVAGAMMVTAFRGGTLDESLVMTQNTTTPRNIPKVTPIARVTGATR